MEKKISIGVIGSGGIARGAHLPNYQKMDQVDILAVADINLETAKKAGEEYDVPHIFTDYESCSKLRRLTQLVSAHRMPFMHPPRLPLCKWASTCCVKNRWR